MSENEQYKFLSRIVDDILQHNDVLHNLIIVLPNKFFSIHIKKIFSKKGYQGILPKFQTLEEVITEISGIKELSGIPLWIFSYKIYRKLYPLENFKSFIGWFPIFLNDWNEILKSTDNDTEVIDFMLSDERTKKFKQNSDNNNLSIKNSEFWNKIKLFIPILKEKLLLENLGTKGIIYQIAKNNIEYFSEKTKNIFIFCLFNDLNFIEQNLIRKLLQNGKSTCFFRSDEYYINNELQEAGRFIRNYKEWRELTEDTGFKWIDKDFVKEKNINIFEVSGNITQTKILPNILTQIKNNSSKFDNTAIILLDENLIFPTINAINNLVKNLDVNIKYPLKNLSFTIFISRILHLQKQLSDNSNIYYHQDIVSILEELHFSEKDFSIINVFIEYIKDRNIVYISKDIVQNYLSELSYFQLLILHENVQTYLDTLINFCAYFKLKEDICNIEYENILNIEEIFINLKIQLENHDFLIDIDILEILLNKSISDKNVNLKINSENGIKIMNLSDARAFNFENIIMLSVNEGKLPIGKTQNTFLPVSVRRNFRLNTFIENDSIDAYDFYSSIQDAKNINILFNGLSGGFNTGEKSRFITQIELESPHNVHNFIVNSESEPIEKKPVIIRKTSNILEKLDIWKQKISPSHINSYLYNPIDFFIEKILEVKEYNELEEELSSINFGNLVHNVLEYLYREFIGKIISIENLLKIQDRVENAMEYVITKKLNHSISYYNKGINYIHREVALRTVKGVIEKDINDIKDGNIIELLALEHKVSADFYLDDEKQSDKVKFHGFIDRIDRFNEKLRIIDYKTGKESDLNIKTENAILFDSKYRQELQLSIYAYCILNSKEFVDNELQCGIWSFINPMNGAKMLKIINESLINKSSIEIPMKTIRNIILEILNPNIDFIEK